MRLLEKKIEIIIINIMLEIFTSFSFTFFSCSSFIVFDKSLSCFMLKILFSAIGIKLSSLFFHQLSERRCQYQVCYQILKGKV